MKVKPTIYSRKEQLDAILAHVGHPINAVTYNDDKGVVNAAIECEECGAVIIDVEVE